MLNQQKHDSFSPAYHFSSAIPTGLFSLSKFKKEIAYEVKHNKLRLVTEYEFNRIL